MKSCNTSLIFLFISSEGKVFIGKLTIKRICNAAPNLDVVYIRRHFVQPRAELESRLLYLTSSKACLPGIGSQNGVPRFVSLVSAF